MTEEKISLLRSQVKGEWAVWQELDRIYRLANNYSKVWWAEKHLSMLNMSNCEVDGLQ